MKVEDYPQVKLFMEDNYFKEEPICVASEGNVQRFYEKEKDEYHISMIKQGTCLLALNEQTGGSITGVALGGEQVPSDLERLCKEAASTELSWGKMTVLQAKIEMEIKLFERYGISKVLYFHIIAVDAAMRGKSIGSRLAAALMKVGRSKGYTVMWACCTSFYSAKQQEQLGMECIYQLAYADYKDDKGEVVFKPAAPHTHVRVMASKL